MSTAPLPDQDRRDRFAHEIGANVSLIAPAGVGKTHSIVDRIIGIASSQNPHAMEWLPRLVVVTYTNSAAEEMRQRARNAIIASGARGAALAQFNRGFFGTIHSFCLMLLQRFGHHLGLPAGLEIAEDPDGLWRDFLRQGRWRISALPQSSAEALFRRVPMLEVLGLARGAPHLPARDPGGPPGVEAGTVLGFPAKGNGKKNILLGQSMVRRWLELDAAGEPFAPPPECPGGGEAFKAEWARAFRPLREWLGAAAWVVAREIAGAFREYRLTRGQMTYDDQVALAGQLMRDPEAAASVRAEGYRVILDEAQDTDREQLIVLTEVARPPGAKGIWLEGGGRAGLGPEPGRFALVGDPQQLIYQSRASLVNYAELREALSREGGLEIPLDVTFRFKSTIADFVNRVGPHLLDGAEGQAQFVPLQTMGCGGRVVRWVVESPTDETLGIVGTGQKPTDASMARAEAADVARRLRETGLIRLGASDWSEVAVLCPRRRWLETMEEALVEQGFDVQNHSARECLGGSAAYAWFSALVWVMAEPRDGFEIAGVLREVFGVADADIAEFTGGDGTKLWLVDDEDGRMPTEEDPFPTSNNEHSTTDDRHSTTNGRGATPGDQGSSSDDKGASDSRPGLVGAVLGRLAALRVEVAGRPLREAVLRIVGATGLRERLEALPRDEWDPGMLDVLLLRAATAEEDGLTLGEWAESLRNGFSAKREGESVRRGAIQLITCHKAKGLQWECVVLPFLCRSVRNRSPEYPRVVPMGSTAVPMVVFGGGELGADRELVLRRGEEQEMQRLLYVAVTRARHALVLVDDRKVFEKRAGSFFERSGFGGDSAEAFDGLPTGLVGEDVAVAEDVGGEQPVTAEVPHIDLDLAIRSANEFPRRRLPHALVAAQRGANDAEPETGLAKLSEGDEAAAWGAVRADDAAEYGIWWHGLMETLPWVDGIQGWDAPLAAQIGTCPDPERGQREFARFLGSDFVRSIAGGDKVFHAEVPFVWRDGANSCMEGVMDLVAWDRANQRWIVVDWKTNRVSEGELGKLADRYRPQLKAYVDALRALAPRREKELSVEAYVYSTALGQAMAVAEIV